MRIYIDESGNFSGFHHGSLSVVAALGVCDWRWDKIKEKYSKLRRKFPKIDGEVKGRVLSEDQINEVVSLLRRNEVILEATLIDVGTHTEAGVIKYRDAVADGMTQRLDKFREPSRSEVAQALDQIRKTSAPLFLQAMATFSVLENVISHFPLYFVQRYPKELGNFSWIIDGKNSQRVTDWEKWWSWYGMGVLANRSKIRPKPMLIGADYSYFNKFDSPDLGDGVQGTSLSLLMSDLSFSNGPDIGLELVDVVANAVRRALTGNLQRPGWAGIPKLMIHRRNQYIDVIHLEGAASTPHHRDYETVLRHFLSGGRSMLTPKNSREAYEDDF